MIKVMFVCLGNICRSPMAEFVFKDIVKKNNMEDKFFITSRATSYEEIGNDMHYGSKDKLDEVGVEYSPRKAMRIQAEDYKKYDYIIGMEESNIKNIMRIIGDDKDNKVCRLLDYSDNPRDIADPWYTGNFTIAYNDIKEGCEALFNKIK